MKKRIFQLAKTGSSTRGNLSGNSDREFICSSAVSIRCSAASEAQGLEAAGKVVEYSEMQPGDLIFYSYEVNNRYKNISHVAIYIGNGKVVEAKGTNYGVVYGNVPNQGKIVTICRP